MRRIINRKIEVILNIDENDQYLPKLNDPKYEYSQLHKRQGYIKYYAAGVAIENADNFRRSLSRDDKNLMFSTPLVLCLSIDSKIEPNNQFIFKNYRRVYIPFGVEVQSIKLNDIMYKSFPKTTDFTLIKIEQCIVDLDIKQAKIKGTVSNDFTLEESNYDKFHYFQSKVEPLYEHMKNVMVRSDIDLYENEYIANEAYKMATSVLRNLDLLYSQHDESNRHVREKLINALIGNDKITVMPNNEVVLSEMIESNMRPNNQKDFAAGLYEYKGAYFESKSDLDNSMAMCEITGQTEEDIIREKKSDNRYAYMMVFLTPEQRLLEMTEDEINDSYGIIFAMPEDERIKYETIKNNTDEKSVAQRDKLKQAARLRWKAANGRM